MVAVLSGERFSSEPLKHQPALFLEEPEVPSAPCCSGRAACLGGEDSDTCSVMGSGQSWFCFWYWELELPYPFPFVGSDEGLLDSSFS